MVNHIDRTIKSLHCFVSLIMSRSYNDQLIMETDDLIKIFLSEFSQLECMMGYHVKQQSYLRTGNFLCLLNIPKQMKLHGPLRNFYDANDEKAVQRVKK